MREGRTFKTMEDFSKKSQSALKTKLKIKKTTIKKVKKKKTKIKRIKVKR